MLHPLRATYRLIYYQATTKNQSHFDSPRAHQGLRPVVTRLFLCSVLQVHPQPPTETEQPLGKHCQRTQTVFTGGRAEAAPGLVIVINPRPLVRDHHPLLSNCRLQRQTQKDDESVKIRTHCLRSRYLSPLSRHRNLSLQHRLRMCPLLPLHRRIRPYSWLQMACLRPRMVLLRLRPKPTALPSRAFVHQDSPPNQRHPLCLLHCDKHGAKAIIHLTLLPTSLIPPPQRLRIS
jgi:hypothetical protein